MSDDEVGGEGQAYGVPQSLKRLRCCMRCYLIKTEEQFRNEGCENCPTMRQFGDINGWTTTNFEGFVAIMRPGESWVSRWNKKARVSPGVYSIKVYGEMSQDVMDELQGDAGYDGE
eukprot:TRINITY_DN773_c0_g1_i1.p1 TRINITY_DN773_c0_g1~~TRINITY_DN773_c0_g1_i1.p1  ORF type:complete len:116 (+),score=24.31 TRINITY_DN773_c0_g1_i1:153-500(+)